jgi:hypothetical protein
LSSRRHAIAGKVALGRYNPASAALGLSRRRLATAGNVALGRQDSAPTPPRFPLRSTCLAGGSLPRVTKRLAVYQKAGGGCRPQTPLCAALGLSYRRLAAAGNERDQGGSVKFFASVLELDCSWGCRQRHSLKLAYTASPTTLVHRSRALRPSAPSRSSKTPLPGEARRGAS